uniref:Uncharacterized protein n=1 Tax=Rhizophora mucronata TaxID=61149 RepID=A0A2P2P3H3_RHIMU
MIKIPDFFKKMNLIRCRVSTTS